MQWWGYLIMAAAAALIVWVMYLINQDPDDVLEHKDGRNMK